MNMEVLKIVAHAIITVILIIGYVLLAFVKGDHDPTLQGVLMVAVGYWFGAVTLGKNNVTKQ
jgi:hypothetical protein